MPNHHHQFAVIGLGQFGRTLCRSLLDLGHEVMAIDPREEAVREVHDEGIATHAVQADPENLAALRELDIATFDAVVVSRGTDFEASVLTVLALMELGVPKIIAKAANDRHAQVLEQLGGGRVRVVNPEHDMGLRLANQLTGNDIMEAVWIDPHHGFAEVALPAGFAGQSIAQTQLRTRHGVQLIGVRRRGELHFAPEASFVFEPGDRLVLLGRNEKLESFCS